MQYIGHGPIEGQVYARGVHDNNPLPYQTDQWYASGFCALRRDGKTIKCHTKYGVEDQLFIASDLSKEPWISSSGPPPSYHASNSRREEDGQVPPGYDFKQSSADGLAEGSKRKWWR